MSIETQQSRPYNLGFTAASLRPELARIIAEIFLSCGDWDQARQKVLAENALQARAPASVIRMERELRQRLQTLTRDQLEILARAPADSRRSMAWLAALKHSGFVLGFCSHRTLNERPLVGQHFSDRAALQQQGDADWAELNGECPSRARGCQGQPPLVAQPELLLPPRPYHPQRERAMVDLKRAEVYLATQTWRRTVSSVGQVTLGGYRYGLGMAWATQTVSIRFEPQYRQFVFTKIKPHTHRGPDLPELPPVHRDAQGLTVEELTGLPAVRKKTARR